MKPDALKCNRGHDISVTNYVIKWSKSNHPSKYCLTCSREYAEERRRKRGVLPRTAKPPIERFMNFIFIRDDGCWDWKGHKNNMGYPLFYDGIKNVLAHRFSFCHFKNAHIEYKMQIDHMCNNPYCSNPEHLQKVTNRENTILSYQRRKDKQTIT